MNKKNLLIFTLSISAVIINGFFDIYQTSNDLNGVGLFGYIFEQIMPFLFAITMGTVLSAVITHCIGMTNNRNNIICCGLIIAAIMPLNTPFWLITFATFGGFMFSKLKFMAGGIVHSLNAAVSAKLIVVLLKFPHSVQWLVQASADGWTGATPLQASRICLTIHRLCVDSPLNWLLIGRWNGTPGELSKLAIIVAAIVLLLSSMIRLSSVLWGILGFCLAWFICGQGVGDSLLQQLLMGSFLFALVFMLCNHFSGQLPIGYQCAYAFIYGVLCVVFRVFGPFAEGTLLSLIAAQLITGIFFIWNVSIQKRNTTKPSLDE